MAISAADVKKLRDQTGAGMMDCKAALEEAHGNFEEATTILRKKGLASAAKKAGRAAKEGLIGSRLSADHGAGIGCDGQVLVVHDMLGLFDDFQPKFVKRYADVKTVILGAVKDYISDVKENKFPTEEHSFR